ncbi:MAG: (2Fe-2S)-binding protein, partial [Clostridia bacterium]|nr:(2Fe-2S)-binding protein [Clostridia bacterium]
LGKERKVDKKVKYNPIRKGIPCVKDLPIEERAALIKQNPDYGVIVCRCEEVSKGEILDAIRAPIPATTIDAIKRRVRAGMGRCQGGFCAPIITKMIADECGKTIITVCKKGEGSELLTAPTKEV